VRANIQWNMGQTVPARAGDPTADREEDDISPMPSEEKSRGNVGQCGLHLFMYGNTATDRARFRKPLLEHTKASKSSCSVLHFVPFMGEKSDCTQSPFPSTGG
jgi:hypothetical protein